MDINRKLKRLEYFLVDNDSPILVDFAKVKHFNNPVVIESNITEKELYGDNNEPSWFQKINEANGERVYLIINNITKISKEEQKKFISLFKDRECNNKKIPQNVSIILLIEEQEKELLDKELLSYLIVI